MYFVLFCLGILFQYDKWEYTEIHLQTLKFVNTTFKKKYRNPFGLLTCVKYRFPEINCTMFTF